MNLGVEMQDNCIVEKVQNERVLNAWSCKEHNLILALVLNGAKLSTILDSIAP